MHRDAIRAIEAGGVRPGQDTAIAVDAGTLVADAPAPVRRGMSLSQLQKWVMSVLAVAVGRLIHGRSPLTWWLVLGVLPGVVGAWFTFR